MLYTQLTKKAINIAYNKHNGQIGKDGIPYFCHPYHVAERVDELCERTNMSKKEHEALICIAFLHDILEDTDTTVNELYGEGFSDNIVHAVIALTRRKRETYQDYIERCRENTYAAVIKTFDLIHNMNLNRLDAPTNVDKKRYEKYKKALDLLNTSKEDES